MSWLTLAGMMLGCAAIFGMFHLFKREQEREQVEQLRRAADTLREFIN